MVRESSEEILEPVIVNTEKGPRGGKKVSEKVKGSLCPRGNHEDGKKEGVFKGRSPDKIR